MSVGRLMIIGIILLLFSCSESREREATEKYVAAKVEEGVEQRKNEFLERCREESLAIASQKADSILRAIIFQKLDTLNRPRRPIKPVRPGFEPTNKDEELKPLVDDQLLEWLMAYETFIVGDTSFIRRYLDSILLQSLDSLYLDSIYRDSLYRDSIKAVQKKNKLKK